MEGTVADRVRPRLEMLAGALTIISLFVIFAAVLELVPGRLLPRSDPLLSAIPHVNVALSLSAIGTITIGLWAIRENNVRLHRRAMLASTVLFGCFLGLYLYRVAILGPTPFAGPDFVRMFVFYPLLFIHVTFAIICLPFLYLALLLAWTTPVDQLHQTSHPRVGRIAAFLWVVSFTLGICIYVLLHGVY